MSSFWKSSLILFFLLACGVGAADPYPALVFKWDNIVPSEHLLNNHVGPVKTYNDELFYAMENGQFEKAQSLLDQHKLDLSEGLPHHVRLEYGAGSKIETHQTYRPEDMIADAVRAGDRRMAKLILERVLPKLTEEGKSKLKARGLQTLKGVAKNLHEAKTARLDTKVSVPEYDEFIEEDVKNRQTKLEKSAETLRYTLDSLKRGSLPSEKGKGRRARRNRMQNPTTHQNEMPMGPPDANAPSVD